MFFFVTPPFDSIMKHIVILCGLIGFAIAYVPHKRSLAISQERTFIEELIEKVINGIIEKIKSNDPINVEEYTISISNYDVVIHNLTVKGLKDLQSSVSVIVDLKTEVELDFSFPRISAIIESWESTLPILYGKGNFSVELNEFDVFVHVIVNVVSGGLKPSCIVKTSMGSASVSVNGFLNDPELSQNLVDVLEFLLNDFMNDERFHAILGQLLNSLLEQILGKIIG